MSIDKNTIEIEKIKEALEEINEQIGGLDGRIISNELTLKKFNE